MEKIDTITLMITHRQTILNTYEDTGKNAAKTHELLKEKLPELQISLSQFKPYIRAMALTVQSMTSELRFLQQENQDLKKQISSMMTEIKALKSGRVKSEIEISDLKKELSIRPAPDREKEAAKNIDGWNVVLSGGYYRLFRKINGRMEAIYIGKKLDTEKARAKIRDKEKALGLDM